MSTLKFAMKSCLPSCSLEVSDDAYLLPTPDLDSYNTEKTKSRFYHRTGGILVMGKPCGILVDVAEIFGGESITQVAEMIKNSMQALDSTADNIKCIVYDDACHLKKHVDRRSSAVYPKLKQTEMKVDRFHFPNHVGVWCKMNMDPSNCTYLDGVNTEIMEQVFAWLKGYAPSLRYMKRAQYRFIILDLLDRHNEEIIFAHS